MNRYAVMAPGLAREVHVYAYDRAGALEAAAHEIGAKSLPEGAVAVPVINDHWLYLERAFAARISRIATPDNPREVA